MRLVKTNKAVLRSEGKSEPFENGVASPVLVEYGKNLTLRYPTIFLSLMQVVTWILKASFSLDDQSHLDIPRSLKSSVVFNSKNESVNKLISLNTNDKSIIFSRSLPFLNLSEIIIQKRKKEKLNHLAFQIGLSQWNFNLNNNYLTALNPADFVFNEGKGIHVGLNYQRQLNKKFSFYSQFQTDYVRSESGHNSTCQLYLRQRECKYSKQ